MDALPLTGCVFRNADDVEAFDDERDGAGWSAEMVVWCLNDGAARRARDLGWKNVESVDAARLARAMEQRRARL
jgi:hypothetical protein